MQGNAPNSHWSVVSSQQILDEGNLSAYLVARGIVAAGSPVRVEAAGDGNINWVRRARCDTGSWIVKQARPALERFPEYRVSTERIAFEARYYEAVRPLDAANVCPQVLDFDPDQRVLILEDLGTVPRLDRALLDGRDGSAVARRLGEFLGKVHRATRGPEMAGRFENQAMRELHGEHIFSLPFRPNDFPLAEPVAARAKRLWGDSALVALADAAYARYRAPRGALVHADVQAGNILLAPEGAKLLDAEIAHLGDPAFDLGVLFAHFLLPAFAHGDFGVARAALGEGWEAYAAQGEPASVRFEECARYAGIEILRRTLGAARVPAVESVDASLAAVDFGERWLREPPRSPAGLAG